MKRSSSFLSSNCDTRSRSQAAELASSQKLIDGLQFPPIINSKSIRLAKLHEQKVKRPRKIYSSRTVLSPRFRCNCQKIRERDNKSDYKHAVTSSDPVDVGEIELGRTRASTARIAFGKVVHRADQCQLRKSAFHQAMKPVCRGKYLRPSDISLKTKDSILQPSDESSVELTTSSLRSVSSLSSTSSDSNTRMNRHDKSQFSLLGYDWIAGCLDNEEESVLNRSDGYFEKLQKFREDCSSECISSLSTDPSQLSGCSNAIIGSEESSSRLQTSSSTHSSQAHTCVASYRLRRKLCGVPGCLKGRRCVICNKVCDS